MKYCHELAEENEKKSLKEKESEKTENRIISESERQNKLLTKRKNYCACIYLSLFSLIYFSICQFLFSN